MKVLSPKHYELAVRPLKDVRVNNLFARSVAEKHVDGTILVDNLTAPRIFYVVHPYGMALLYGDIDANYIGNELKNYLLEDNSLRQKTEWLQIYPSEWESQIDSMFGDKIVVLTENHDQQSAPTLSKNVPIIKHKRVNFKFERDRYNAFKKENITEKHEIIRTDSRLFAEMTGSVVPQKFWDDDVDFMANGVGFSLIYEGNLATTAFSSFIHDDLLELGMETKPEYRNNGFAKYACVELIDYCLENGYEPIWSCGLDNRGSYYLAQKLGFVPTKYLPYYECLAR